MPFLRPPEVGLDRVRGIDDHGLTRGLVADQVGRAAEIVVDELAKLHGRRLTGCAGISPASYRSGIRLWYTQNPFIATRALAVAFLFGVLAALAPQPADAGPFDTALLPRSTVDRPDDFGGLQVHVIYAVPSDGADRAFDTSGGIESSTASYQAWLSGQTGGRVLRFDTYQGPLDITFQRLPRPDAEYAALGRGARELHRAGSQGCRARHLAEDLPRLLRRVEQCRLRRRSLAARVARDGLRLLPAQRDFGTSPLLRQRLRGRRRAASIHGVRRTARLHARPGNRRSLLSALLGCGARQRRSEQLLMWSRVGSWTPSILDAGRDDYFQAHIPGCPDLDTSGFLTSDTDFALTVSKVGSGSGAVVSSPWSVIDCGETCTAPYGRGTVVTLTARPEGDSTFDGWEGACSGTNPCAVTIDAAKTVTARFNAPDREVVTEILGSGQGTVTSRPVGLRCPPTCSAIFPGQSILELRASARPGSRFTGWTEDCSGTACSFTLDRDKSVGATFADVQAPRVRALASRGSRGGRARLRYRVNENTGVARVTIRVGRRSVRTPYRRLAATRTYSALWRLAQSATPGGHRFCVRASDRSRHTSRWSCAALTVR